MTKLNFSVGNDNGNSEQKMNVDGKMFKFPNVFAIITTGLKTSDAEPLELIPGLLENLCVTIQSRAIASPKMVFIGERAIKSDKTLNNMDITLGMKHKDDLPIINTLGNLAAIALQKACKGKQKLPKDLEVSVDMTTALPANEWTRGRAEFFSNRFTENEHTVTVHVGHQDVFVKIKFDYVKTLQEGTPSLFTIIEDGKGNYRNDDMFDFFKKTYDLPEVDGEFFKGKTLLHQDIGDGTNESIVTRSYAFDADLSSGSDTGIGHAIEEAMVLFEGKREFLPTRQEFSSYLINKNHKFHKTAQGFLNETKVSLSARILRELENKMRKMKYEIDVVVIYGGGSIQLQDVMYLPLKELCDKHEIQVLWIPEKYATIMNAEGMGIFNTTILPKLKEKAQVK